MSFNALLIHTVTVYNIADQEATDRYGNPVPSLDEESDAISYPARVQQLSAAEIDDLTRDTRITSYRVFLKKDVDVSELSVIEWEGVRYKVNGKPNIVDGRKGPHHIELTMERPDA